MNVLIGGAWVYANGSLHIGHIASLLPGDVIARYFRLKGEQVSYVSGSDCHGTPVTIRAKKENLSPFEVSEKYHQEFREGFDYLGFSYDYYGKTSSEGHKDFVKAFHSKLYESDYVYEKEEPQAYCGTCQQFLPDRLVTGTCPNCGKGARGDQCDHCGNVYGTEELLAIKCSECGSAPEWIVSKHLFLAVSRLEKELKELVYRSPNWRKNALAFTNRYINEGLRDRAITRDLNWGIEVPKPGYEDKKIYIWAENVLGYLSSSALFCQENDFSFEEVWGSDALHFYVHGKDNIPFHSIILPSLLLANGSNYRLPDQMVSSEYLTLEGRKISTSANWAIWVKDLMGKYNPDALRYFMIAKRKEKRDTDFSWREFVNSNNGELLGAYGNLVNRTLVFIKKSFDGKVPKGRLKESLTSEVNGLYKRVGEAIESGEFKAGLEEIFNGIRSMNKYFDEEKPWITLKEEKVKCEETLFNCVYVIANLAQLLEPFLPFSSEKIITWFGLERQWREQFVPAGFNLPEIEILFERLDKKIIDEELERLKKVLE